MNERSRQRAARREELQLQCAQQRARLAVVLEDAQHHLRPIDHALTTIRNLRRTPLLLGGVGALAALAASLLTGRRRPRAGGMGRWTEWLALAGPLLQPALQPLLGALQRWWQSRQSAAAEAAPDDHR